MAQGGMLQLSLQVAKCTTRSRDCRLNASLQSLARALYYSFVMIIKEECWYLFSLYIMYILIFFLDCGCSNITP